MHRISNWKLKNNYDNTYIYDIEIKELKETNNENTKKQIYRQEIDNITVKMNMKFTAQNMQTIIYQDYSIIMKILKKQDNEYLQKVLLIHTEYGYSAIEIIEKL